MDAKMRADFVNSVASGQKVPCPVCNTLNDPDGSFCIACGHSLKKEEKKDENSGTVICPVCQNANKKGFRFCTVCGNKLDEAESTKSSDPVTPQPAAAPAQSKAAGQQPAAPAQDVQRNMAKMHPRLLRHLNRQKKRQLPQSEKIHRSRVSLSGKKWHLTLRSRRWKNIRSR